jgi:hypothetical protein
MPSIIVKLDINNYICNPEKYKIQQNKKLITHAEQRCNKAVCRRFRSSLPL